MFTPSGSVRFQVPATAVRGCQRATVRLGTLSDRGGHARKRVMLFSASHPLKRNSDGGHTVSGSLFLDLLKAPKLGRSGVKVRHRLLVYRAGLVMVRAGGGVVVPLQPAEVVNPPHDTSSFHTSSLRKRSSCGTVQPNSTECKFQIHLF